jgi:hypothetical protein
MTTVREARITAVYRVVADHPDFFPITDHQIQQIAELAVDALFTSNPHLDNVQVPVKVQIEG